MNTIRSLFTALLLGGLSVLPVVAGGPHHWRHESRYSRPYVPTVTFYEHADFRGASLTLEVGEGIVNLDHVRFDNGSRINDRISSIRVDGPVEVTVFEHAGYGGRGLLVSGDVRNLDWLAGRWNDVISSMHVRPARLVRGRY